MLGRRNGLLGAALVSALTFMAGCSGDPPGETLGPDATAPGAQLGKGAAYRRAWGTPDLNIALGLSNLNPQTRVGTLELLVKDKAPVVLSSGTDINVKVSDTKPAAALFLENVGANAVGNLNRADLATAEKKALPSAAQVLAEGFWFGPASDRILFIAEPDETVKFGKLYWSDTTSSDELGSRVSPRGVLFSADRKVAVVGVDVTGQNGTLIHVDLMTGVPKTISEGAQVLEGQEPAFSISDDASTVAFTTSAGAVMLWKNGTATQVAAAGKLPGVSADGTMVAFGNEGKVIVVAAGSAAVEISDSTGSIAVAAPPVFSPNKDFVAWFSSLVRRGGLVGEAWVAPAIASGAPQKIGGGVAVNSLKFTAGPNLFAVAELRDLMGNPAYNGYGQVLVGNPAETLPKFADKVMADSVGVFNKSGRVAAVANIVPGEAVGNAIVSPATPGGEPVELGKNVIPSSLRVSKTEDRVIYLVREAKDGKTTLDDGTPFGTLYIGTPDGKTELQESFVVYADTFGGRAIAVVGSGANAGVWSLPLGLR